MAKTNHIHKYRKAKLTPQSNTVIFRCVLPDCSHYVYPNLYKGKQSICWRCSKPFTIDREHQRMAKPHCSNCIIRKGGKEHAPITNEQVDDILTDLGIFDN